MNERSNVPSVEGTRDAGEEPAHPAVAQQVQIAEAPLPRIASGTTLVVDPDRSSSAEGSVSELGDRPAPARWPAHLRPGAVRWVRSSTHYEDTVRFYRDLVGLPVVDSFSESYGEDGTIFGLPNTLTHMEIVRSDHPDASADRFDQIVLYLEDATAVATAVKPLLDAGLAPVANPHPYWLANRGMVFLDPDGRGIVYAPWVFGQQPDPADGFPQGGSLGTRIRRDHRR